MIIQKLILVFLLLAQASAFGQGSAAMALREHARTLGSARVIIELRLEKTTPAIGESGPQLRARHLGRIKEAQALVVSDLRVGSVRKAHHYTHFPLVFADLDERALAAAMAHPRVLRLHEDRLDAPTLAQSAALVGATDAWSSGYGGNGQVVAILDTGVDREHSFLTGKVVSEACYSSNDTGFGATTVCPNGLTEQTGTGSGLPCTVAGCDHGTHVTGIAAGKGLSFSGVARDAGIIAIQVFSRFTGFVCDDDSDPCIRSFTSDQIKALDRVYALRNTFSIASVNMSLGGSISNFSACDSAPQKPAIDALRLANIGTIIASGNNGFTGGISAPACISSAISVGSTTKGDAVSSFSNSSPMLALLAPGSAINSSVSGGAFAFKSGTSMATPHVAGAFAVLKSKNPGSTVTQLKDALIASGKPINDARNGTVKPRIRVDPALDVTGLTSPATNDDFANATLRLMTPPRVTGHNLDATKEAGEPNHAANNGGRSVWWRWTAPVTRLMELDTTGSSFDTLLAVYAGAAVNALTLVAANDDIDAPGGVHTSRVVFNAIAGTIYRIAVDGYNNGLGAEMGNIVLNVGTAVADHDGDGKSEILWRNSVTGENAIWNVNGRSFLAGAMLETVSDTNWRMVGVGDFDGNGKADILWRNMVTGDNAIWLMSGFALTGSALIPAVPDAAWKIAAVGDFNGDGKADVLWRNTMTGDNAIWLMNGFNVAGSALIARVVEAGWTIAGVGDFNGDGKADILWREASSGAVGVWLMDGFTITTSAIVGNAPGPWSIAGVGDYDGNGKSDILWRNVATGDNAIWLIDGVVLARGALILRVADAIWTIVAAGDYNGDGKADILWRNTSTGENAVWLMDGSTLISSALILSVADQNWTILKH